MEHSSYEQMVSEFVDDELESARENELFTHLYTCVTCRDFLKSTISIDRNIFLEKPRDLSINTYSLDDKLTSAKSALPSAINLFNGRLHTARLFAILLLVMVCVGFLFSAISGIGYTGEQVQVTTQSLY